jgi:hypothetical protein
VEEENVQLVALFGVVAKNLRKIEEDIPENNQSINQYRFQCE